MWVLPNQTKCNSINHLTPPPRHHSQRLLDEEEGGTGGGTTSAGQLRSRRPSRNSFTAQVCGMVIDTTLCLYRYQHSMYCCRDEILGRAHCVLLTSLFPRPSQFH